MSDEYELSDVFVSAMEKGEAYHQSPEGQLNTIISSLPDNDPVKPVAQRAFTAYAREAQPQAQERPVGDGLVTIKTGSGASFSVHSDYHDRFKGFLSELEGMGYHVDPKQSGGYNFRRIAGTNSWSNHAFGAAIDVNWHVNTRSRGQTNLPDNIGEVAQRHGLAWGGTWSNPDYMHFEIAGANRSRQLRPLASLGSSTIEPSEIQSSGYTPIQGTYTPTNEPAVTSQKALGQQIVDMTPEFMGMLGSVSKATPSIKKGEAYKLSDYTG